MQARCSKCGSNHTGSSLWCLDCQRQATEGQAVIARLQAEVERFRKIALRMSMEQHVPVIRLTNEMRRQQSQATDDYMALVEQLKTAHNDALQDASDVDMILEALMSVHDMDVTLEDYAKAVSEAIRALKRT